MISLGGPDLEIGVNVISGASASDTSPLQNGPQDYIIAGCQPWIDGIVSGPGVVRQVSLALHTLPGFCLMNPLVRCDGHGQRLYGRGAGNR